MTSISRVTPGRITADRWPTEMPLFLLVVSAAILIWVLLIVSIFGILYGIMLGLFFFMSHLVFVAHLRGSGVRLGRDQLPDLHGRIVDLARAMDMDPPEAYLVQAGGSLNAFATRFLGRNIMVLYSDLLEACGENEGARDMIIAHELAHLRCGHLRWSWFTLPGHFVPFLGGALSRAREYTCDRYGLQAAKTPSDATFGLSILSAGAKFAPAVNLQAFVRQREDTNTGMMTLGEWFSSHPPLAKRVAELDPSLAVGRFHPGRGRAMALAIIAFVTLGGTGLGVGGAMLGSRVMEVLEPDADVTAGNDLVIANPMTGRTQVDTDFARLSEFIAQEWSGDSGPASMVEIRELWSERQRSAFPLDPFDGLEYGYEPGQGSFVLWSSGPDGLPGTDDDIRHEFGS